GRASPRCGRPPSQGASRAPVSWAHRPLAKGRPGEQRGRMAKAAAEDVAATDAQSRVLTIPNAISVARLAAVPVFVWLVLGLRTQAGDWWAVGLLIASGASDWLDGKIARALNQQT